MKPVARSFASAALLVSLVALLTAACTDPVLPAIQVSRIELRHFSRTVAVKGEVTLSAVAFDSRNRVVPTPSLTWTSDDPSIASVDAVGRLTGHRLGTVQVRATTADGVQAGIGIDVRAAELRVTLHSGSATMIAGETALLRAELFDAEGGPILSTAPIRWVSGDSTIASVRPVVPSSGTHAEVRGNSSGLVVITALVGADVQAYPVGVIIERPPLDAPLQIVELAFFEFMNLSDFMAVGPALMVRVSEGRAAEILRVDVLPPTVHPNTFPPLCTFGTLSAGHHEILGPRHYSWEVFEAFRSFSPHRGEGMALLTYRADNKTYGVIARGSVVTQGFSLGYAAGYRWTTCAS